MDVPPRRPGPARGPAAQDARRARRLGCPSLWLLSLGQARESDPQAMDGPRKKPGTAPERGEESQLRRTSRSTNARVTPVGAEPSGGLGGGATPPYDSWQARRSRTRARDGPWTRPWTAPETCAAKQPRRSSRCKRARVTTVGAERCGGLGGGVTPPYGLRQAKRSRPQAMDGPRKRPWTAPDKGRGEPTSLRPRQPTRRTIARAKRCVSAGRWRGCNPALRPSASKEK
jgi:hypothetical protein